MSNLELLEALDKDLSKLNINRDEHIRVQQILQAYKRNVLESQKEEEVLEDNE